MIEKRMSMDLNNHRLITKQSKKKRHGSVTLIPFGCSKLLDGWTTISYVN